MNDDLKTTIRRMVEWQRRLVEQRRAIDELHEALKEGDAAMEELRQTLAEWRSEVRRVLRRAALALQIQAQRQTIGFDGHGVVA